MDERSRDSSASLQPTSARIAAARRVGARARLFGRSAVHFFLDYRTPTEREEERKRSGVRMDAGVSTLVDEVCGPRAEVWESLFDAPSPKHSRVRRETAPGSPLARLVPLATAATAIGSSALTLMLFDRFAERSTCWFTFRSNGTVELIVER